MRIYRQVLFFLTLQFLICSAYFGRSQALPYDPGKLYPAEALKADLRFVHESLEKKHAGLYRYISRTDLNRFFDSLDHTLTSPTNTQGFFNLLTLLHSKIRNGHTMFLPGDSAMAFMNRSGTFLPLMVHYAEGKLSIVENYSADNTIEPGMEIVRINGTNASSIIEQLLMRQVRDGYNLTYPVWIINHYFSAYYSIIIGQPNTYSLELKSSTGKLFLKQVAALTKDSIRCIKRIRYDVRNPSTNDNQGIVFQVEKQDNVAVLKIKTFDADLLQYNYRQGYKHVFDSIFIQINRHHIRDLILDLRDNQGGDFSPGRTLLSYLVRYPSRFLLDGKEASVIQPRAAHFNGRMFVLINGGSFSITAIVCACLKRDRRAIFIGEETGGNSHVISGDPEELMLPHTKIKADISTTTYRIIPGTNDGHGVMPDYPLLPLNEDILAGKDPEKSLALKLISVR